VRFLIHYYKGEAMNENKSSGTHGSKLIFTCSGIADVGEIADRAGRKLHKDGIGKMWCLSGIGAGLGNFIESTKAAEKVLVIDGCPVNCAKTIMEKAGISKFSYVRVTDEGFEKGKSPVTDNAIEKLSLKGREIFAF
jgi:uncharacterized metal-binding protein